MTTANIAEAGKSAQSCLMPQSNERLPDLQTELGGLKNTLSTLVERVCLSQRSLTDDYYAQVAEDLSHSFTRLLGGKREAAQATNEICKVAYDFLQGRRFAPLGNSVVAEHLDIYCPRQRVFLLLESAQGSGIETQESKELKKIVERLKGA